MSSLSLSLSLSPYLSFSQLPTVVIGSPLTMESAISIAVPKIKFKYSEVSFKFPKEKHKFNDILFTHTYT